jgi:aryl-alcohol dehydrogenase-like predicted oxidoreductase
MRTYDIKPFDVPVSVIGLGTMIFHPDTTERDHSILSAFVENGGTYVDTAEIYGAVEQFGHSEAVIGDWLAADKSRRGKIVLATKGLIPGFCEALHPGGAKIDPASVHNAIEGSLNRLKTDYLDIWMFHRDDPSKPVGPLVDALDEEVRAGRIKAYGGSNWSTARIAEAIDYARKNGKTEMSSSSPNFSLALANEPFWPQTVTTSESDLDWFRQNNFLMIAWSALGRGFFAKADPNDHSDADLVRVFYSDANFERKRRAEEVAAARNMNMFEVALAYVTNQSFPVVALNGAETIEQVVSSARAGDLVLSAQERDWVDLTSNEKPF